MKSIFEIMFVVVVTPFFSLLIGLIIWSLGSGIRDEVAEGIGSLMIRCSLALIGGIIAVLAIVIVALLILVA